MRTQRLALVVVMAVPLAGVAPAARASCAGPRTGNPYGEAAHVFVGTVAATEHSGYEAHVVVEQVWRGQRTKPIVTVIGGPLHSGVGQEDSMRLRPGTTYVFDVSGDGPSYVVSACSATRPYAHVPVRFRPAGLPPAKADPVLLRRARAMSADGAPSGLTGGLIAAVAVLAIGGVVAGGWRRRARAVN